MPTCVHRPERPIMRAIAAVNSSGSVGQEFKPVSEPIVGQEAGYKVCDIYVWS
jgi:hypothetical protein